MNREKEKGTREYAMQLHCTYLWAMLNREYTYGTMGLVVNI